MAVIVLILCGFAFLFCVPFRLCVLHPVQTVRNAVIDTHTYFAHKKYNLCPSGSITAYVSMSDKVFGNGKTLSAVADVVGKYEQYNGLMVWDGERKRFVEQRVHVISNVHLQTIPYEQLVSLQQVVAAAERFSAIDAQWETLTVVLVLIDEAAAQLNSRSFKTNIDPLFLNTLVTSRHYHMSLCYTSQRYNMVDALLRQVTSTVVACNKVWRWQLQNSYDAWEMENAASPSVLRPLHVGGFFVLDKHYRAYNTYAVVDNLKKAWSNGDLLSEADILSLQCNVGVNMDAVVPNKQFARKIRKAQGRK